MFNKYKWIMIIGLIVLILSSLTFFLRRQTNNQPLEKITKTPLKITTSFYPLYFFTSEIVQDKIEVYNITPAGAEPHDYEPTTKDMVQIETSQLLIMNGSNFEGWAEKIKNTLRADNFLILNISEKLTSEQKLENDPHFWLSPELAIEEVKIITDKIIYLDPKNSEFYLNNSKNLIARLDTLHNKFKTNLTNCKNQDMVTAHSAFNYLAHSYGLNQISISGLSPDEEPTPKKLIEIAKFVKDKNIKYIFFESLVSPKFATTIATETSAKTLVLNPIEGIIEDELNDGKNYFTKMEENLINLKIALECL